MSFSPTGKIEDFTGALIPERFLITSFFNFLTKKEKGSETHLWFILIPM